MATPSFVTRRLETAPTALVVAYGGIAAFCVYFSMYAFRKPYAAGTYTDVAGWHIDFDFKALLVIAQILGYALSKVIGVKVISEMPAHRRAPAIIALIGMSWVGLVLFAVLPVDVKFVGLLLNGLPLGLIWGIVFAFLEGRRTTEILGALLSASFIVSSGIVKTVALTLMNDFGIGEFWMPAATGVLFMPLLFISVWGLSQLPKPDAEDIEARTERKPMNSSQRAAFLNRYGYGVAALVIGYVLLTVFRDFRDDFAVEIWAALGYSGQADVLTESEIPVAVITLIAFAGLILIKDNTRALMVIHAMTFAGGLAVGLFALAYALGLIGAFPLMIGTGAGLYIAYMPFGAMLFERLIAATRQVANAGFLIYVADASGYLGTVTMLITKNLVAPELNWLSFFLWGAGVTSSVCVIGTGTAALYFRRTLRREAEERARLGEQAHREGALAVGTPANEEEAAAAESDTTPVPVADALTTLERDATAP